MLGRFKRLFQRKTLQLTQGEISRVHFARGEQVAMESAWAEYKAFVGKFTTLERVKSHGAFCAGWVAALVFAKRHRG